MTDVVWVCSPPTVATANGSGNPKMKPGQSTPPSAEPPPPQRMKRRTEDIAFVKTVCRDNCSHKKQSAIRRGSGEPAASRLGAGDDSLTRDPEIWLAAIQVQVSIFEIKSNGRSARKCLRGGGKRTLAGWMPWWPWFPITTHRGAKGRSIKPEPRRVARTSTNRRSRR